MSTSQGFYYLTESLKALTPLLIGAFAGYIALRQWRTANHKVKLELFDRRYSVFLATRSLFLAVIANIAADDEEMRRFRTEMAKGRFLFDQRVNDYLDEVRQKASALRNNLRRLDRAISIREAQRVDSLSEKEYELMQWMIDAEERVEDIFLPYLSFRDVR